MFQNRCCRAESILCNTSGLQRAHILLHIAPYLALQPLRCSAPGTGCNTLPRSLCTLTILWVQSQFLNKLTPPMCQGAFLKVYNCLDLNLGLKSYFPNEHIIVGKIRRHCFQLAQSSWKLVLIIIIYHIFSIIVYYLVIYVDLFLLICIVYVQVRFSESTILNESLDSSFTKNVHQ